MTHHTHRAVCVRLAAGILAASAAGADSKPGPEAPVRVTLVDGTVVPAASALEVGGRVVLRSPHSGMARSFPPNLVRAIAESGATRKLNPRRELTPEEAKWRSPVVWADAGEGEPVAPAYARQTWPAARLLVWARPGQGGSGKEAKNWLEDGRPAKSPPDKDTDLLLPAADKGYMVGGSGLKVRHLTIERNARLQGRHWHAEVLSGGNTWIRKGGSLRFVRIFGDEDTIFRRDPLGAPSGDVPEEYRDRRIAEGYEEPMNITHRLLIVKKGGSVEMVGNVSVDDEVMVHSGKLIVNGVFTYSAVTGRGVVAAFDGATVEVQSGAILSTGRHATRSQMNLNVYKGGTLQAGSPERPLRSDAYVLLGCKGGPKSDKAGLYAAAGSKLAVHSADPERAHLVFTALGALDKPRRRDGTPFGDPAKEGPGVILHLAGDTSGLDGAYFDYLQAGGIRLRDPSAREAWKHVTFGEHNAASGAGLFAEMVLGDDLYHQHKPGQNEQWVERQVDRAVRQFGPEDEK